MNTHDTPPNNTRIHVNLGDDATPWGGFHQGAPSVIGDEWFSLYLDAPSGHGPTLCLTPKAVLALAKQLDDLRDDAQALLDAEAVAEGRAA